MRNLLAVVFLIVSLSCSFAQTSFSTDHVVFLKDVDQFLTDSKRDDAKDVSKALQDAWPNFSNSEQNDIIELANTMRGKKLLVYPYFIKYFNCAVAYQQSKQGGDVFDGWKASCIAVMNNLKAGNSKKYEDFLDFSYGLFTQNALFVSSGHTWQLSSNSYELKVEDNAPVLEASGMDLLGIATGDTLQVLNTAGKYYPLDETWKGDNGSADWTRAGFDATDATVRFGHYTIDCSKSSYDVDSARFSIGELNQKDVLGKFSDQTISNNKPETTTFPRFASYAATLDFGTIAPKTELSGGLSVEGSKILASGTGDQLAVLKIYRYDNLLGIVAKAKTFSIKKDASIKSSQAEVNLMLGKDSIYHGGIQFQYEIPTRELTLIRGLEGIQNSAFYDYYHNVELKTDVIYWDMNEPTLLFRNLTTVAKTPVTMESFNYFDVRNMDKYQGVADYNMIEKIKSIVDQTGKRDFKTDELAYMINPNYVSSTIRNTLYKMVADGFIDYDDQKEIVHVRYKVFHYVNSKRKKEDYDQIRIVSQTDTVNGVMDLRSYNVNMRGVNDLVLSDSSNVVVFPARDTLILKKNRDMDFGGYMFAGWLDMHGSGFSFDYDDYRLELSHVDSVILNIPTGDYDDHHMPKVGPIKSTIENVTGTMQIDDKNNKAGFVRHPNMPSLTTTDPSYVYYDGYRTLKGVYKRDKFFFELAPFTMDSLRRYNVATVGFGGKLVSSGIFPDFPERIIIQKDLSLGFQTTKSTITAYGERGNYSGKITLDNTGLRGGGSVKFLASTTKANNIVFYPDSLNALSQTFDEVASVIDGVEFPNVHDVNNRVHWVPYHDSMVVHMDSVPFEIFDNFAKLTGDLVLQSSGLNAAGRVDWPEAALSSNDIEFGKNKMNADSSDFIIKSDDPKKFALQTSNVNANIDFDKRIGEFKSNTDDIATLFPYNQYRTSINEFKWDMDKKIMTFFAPEGTDAEFTSVAPDQDSLSFTGGNAVYNLASYLLQVKKVPYISVVDCRIIPDSGNVVIEANAKMQTLNNAKIETDTIDTYHKFDNVTANIYGKQNFKASGDYHFTSHTGKTQTIHFNDIGVFKDDDKNLHTYAKAGIDTSAHFTLAPKILFKGEADIVSTKEPVEFKGYAKLDVKNPKVKAQWFSVDDFFTPDSAYVYFKDPHNEANQDEAIGLTLSGDSSDLFASFFTPKKSSKDKNLFTANGIVYYDEATKEFVAGDPGKLINGNSRGNVIRYNDATAKVYGEGKMNLGLNFGLVGIDMAGEVNADLPNNESVFTVSMGLKFDLDKDLLEMMGKAVAAGNYDNEETDYSSETFLKAMPEFIDPKDDKTFNENMNKTGNFVRSDQLDYTMFFTDVELKWDKALRVFYNTKPFFISFIDAKNIQRKIPAYLELGYKRTGDFMNLYIPAGDDNWFYFNYTNNNMQVVAGDPAFNDALIGINPEKRHTKSDDGKFYQYNAGTENKKNTFVNRIKFLQGGN